MKSKNIVFIARSLDGYIADKTEGLDWLSMVPNPENIDMGFEPLMNRIDALVMGRKTFETVCSFGIDWPYTKPVFVLSNSLTQIPDSYKTYSEIVNGSVKTVVQELNRRGYHCLYIDGGTTIQNFLREDLIDELIITTIPVLLGGGSKLFSDLPKQLEFEHFVTKVFLNEIVQSHYKRKSKNKKNL